MWGVWRWQATEREGPPAGRGWQGQRCPESKGAWRERTPQPSARRSLPLDWAASQDRCPGEATVRGRDPRKRSWAPQQGECRRDRRLPGTSGCGLLALWRLCAGGEPPREASSARRAPRLPLSELEQVSGPGRVRPRVQTSLPRLPTPRNAPLPREPGVQSQPRPRSRVPDGAPGRPARPSRALARRGEASSPRPSPTSRPLPEWGETLREPGERGSGARARGAPRCRGHRPRGRQVRPGPGPGAGRCGSTPRRPLPRPCGQPGQRRRPTGMLLFTRLACGFRRRSAGTIIKLICI